MRKILTLKLNTYWDWIYKTSTFSRACCRRPVILVSQLYSISCWAGDARHKKYIIYAHNNNNNDRTRRHISYTFVCMYVCVSVNLVELTLWSLLLGIKVLPVSLNINKISSSVPKIKRQDNFGQKHRIIRLNIL